MEPVTTFADHAPGLAEAGWSVLPLKTRGKVPLIPHAMGGRGHKDATTDAARVARWARAYPTANIGGRVPAALVVIDVDPRQRRRRDGRPLGDRSRSAADHTVGVVRPRRRRTAPLLRGAGVQGVPGPTQRHRRRVLAVDPNG